MTNDKPYEMKLTVALDQRDKFGEAERKAHTRPTGQGLVRRQRLDGSHHGVAGSLAQSQPLRASDEAARKAVADFAGKLDVVCANRCHD